MTTPSNTTPGLIVGVTGHRPNRLALDAGEIARRLRWTLAALRAGTDGTRLTAVSAIAEGADRLFAQAALDLGYGLTALLPFASADYETTFSDAGTTPAYHALKSRADEVVELPGRLADTKSAYETVGAETVARSDCLVAVWDGGDAAGRGGTPDIMSLAVRRGLPVIWIDAANARLPCLIRAPHAHGARDMPVATLATLAARARPATRRQLAKLARGLVGDAGQQR